jgi:hypothetical protein
MALFTYARESTADEYATLLTPKNPLGPLRHEEINKAIRKQYSHALLSQTELFDIEVQLSKPFIFGRRGSGKTALINAKILNLQGEGYFRTEIAEKNKDRKRNMNLVVKIDSFSELQHLQNNIKKRIVNNHGGKDGAVNWASIDIDYVSNLWDQEIWRKIFPAVLEQLQDKRLIDRALNSTLSIAVNRIKILLDANYSEINGGWHYDVVAYNRNKMAAREAVESYLSTTQSNCTILVDSLKSYPLDFYDISVLQRGFFNCISRFSTIFPGFNVICAFPEELSELRPDLFSLSPDFTAINDAASFLHWRPVDVLKIIAVRYRDFFRINLNADDRADTEHLEKINSFDFSTRHDLISFFNIIMPLELENRFGCKEPTIAYIVRHTEILPRQFISIFNKMLQSSFRTKHHWRFIDQIDIRNAISEAEKSSVKDVLDPYRDAYPALVENLQSSVSGAGLSPIFHGSSDIKKFAGLARAAGLTKPELLAKLFSMGVIGYLDEGDGSRGLSDYYHYARFHFNSTSEFSFNPEYRYCFHPIFSGAFGLRTVENHAIFGMFIYPCDMEYLT